jgi:hypothetical protein
MLVTSYDPPYRECATEDEMREARNKEGCFLSLSRRQCEPNPTEPQRGGQRLGIGHPTTTPFLNKQPSIQAELLRKPPNRQSSASAPSTDASSIPLIVRARTTAPTNNQNDH